MKSTLAFIFLFVVYSGLTQTHAVTETGDEVILYDDGSWSFLDGDLEAEDAEIPINESSFEKDKKSTFQIKSKKLDVGLSINPKEWSFSRSTDNESAEFEFQMKGEDLYGMMITEKFEIPLETLKQIALDNARSAANDIQLMKEEYRMVNGVKVLMMQIKGSIQGIKFIYFGYYYSSSMGTVQLVSYTGEGLFEEYYDKAEIFLNGFEEL
ncbi:MAG: hypothetical protein ABJ004_02960 [Cyclobacteriaceae bacterium]